MEFLKFYDDEQRKFFLRHNGEKLDIYNKSLVYLLSLTEDTRKHFASIYDESKREINIDILSKSWQTSTSIIICRLAFNLFNGFIGTEEKEAKSYVVDNIFYIKEFAPYFWQAIKVRFEIKGDI